MVERNREFCLTPGDLKSCPEILLKALVAVPELPFDAESRNGGDAEAASSREAEILRETNKRITLNLLIQGAAFHTSLTSHYVVKEELESLRPGLTRNYDRLAVSLAINYFYGDFFVLYGLPSRFWRRTDKPTHPFHRHRLLATHGYELWKSSKRYLLARGWKKWIIGIPFLHLIQLFYLLAKVWYLERRRRPQLTRIATQANSLIWGIDEDRLDASLTRDIEFGNLQTPKTSIGQMLRQGACGYGGVERRNGQFYVVAKAWNWPLVSSELTKGTIELICLHGLNTLDAEVYRLATEEADQLEYEVWMHQTGGELWRRFLAVVPEGLPLPDAVMQVARLNPDALEELMLAVAADPPRARKLMAALAED